MIQEENNTAAKDQNSLLTTKKDNKIETGVTLSDLSVFQTSHDMSIQMFASDNYAGVHPLVIQALTTVNGGHLRSYGSDTYTKTLQTKINALFGPTATFFPMLTGTGANVVALQALAARHESVICASTAHIHVDEGGAPERLGIKLLTVDTPDGKLTPELIASQAWGWGDQHRGQPGVVSITQTTELGTVYTPLEITAICEFAHSNNMRVHLDGARLANAAVALGVPVREFTTDAGVDILSFGATKNGALAAEGLVVLNPTYTPLIPYLRKGSAQLASKMRFVSAQYLALLENDLWLDLASNANAMAIKLANDVENMPGIVLAQPTAANAVFAFIDPNKAPSLADELGFYLWDSSTGLVRWMTSWDTTPKAVEQFVKNLKQKL
jgi:threonine aldolase